MLQLSIQYVAANCPPCLDETLFDYKYAIWLYNYSIYIYTANAWALPRTATTTGNASSSSSPSSSSSSTSSYLCWSSQLNVKLQQHLIGNGNPLRCNAGAKPSPGVARIYIYSERERERFPEKYPEIGCSTINHPLIEVFRATPFPNGSNIHVISPWHPHDLPHGSVLRGIQQFEGSFGQQNVLRHFAGLVS